MFRISLQPIEVSYAFARLTSVLLRVHNVNEELETNETDFVSSSCHDMTGRGLCKCFLFSSLGFMVRFEKLPHLLCNTSHFGIEICNKSFVEFIQNWKSSYCCNILRFLAETCCFVNVTRVASSPVCYDRNNKKPPKKGQSNS